MDERLLDVDRHGVLRPPLSFWFCSIFLLRHWILLIIVAVSSVRSPATIQWALAALSPMSLVIEAPMGLLVLAWTRRVPDGGPWVRRLWRRGREIITLTAVLNLASAMAFLWGKEEWDPWPERFVAILALVELFIIVSVWRSAVYRRMFEEFPPARAPKGHPT